MTLWSNGVMTSGSGRLRHRAWLGRARRCLAVVAAAGQLTLLLATGADAWRGRDASSHIERAGTHLHHAHDEASCVACAVQTLHAPHARPAIEWSGTTAPQAVTTKLASARAWARDHPSNGSRAPPLEN